MATRHSSKVQSPVQIWYPALMITLEQAIMVAANAHEGQVDKLGHPYILHPLRVMLSFGHDEVDERIVAVLHDVLEDTDITQLDLISMGVSFSQHSAISALTHKENEPREVYIRRVMKNRLARRVKIADINDNLSRIEYLPVETQDRLRAKYAADLRLIYSA